MKNPNFLILDEPTNDLDIMTLNVLENFLEDFPGCLIIVTHDRYFMDKLVDHLFVLEGDGEVKDFNGKYTDYQNYLEEQQEAEREKKSELQRRNELQLASLNSRFVPAKEKEEKKKLSYKEKYEFEQLEKELEKLEERKIELTELLQQNLSADEMVKITTEFGDISKKIDEKTERWMELAELIN